MKCLRFFDVLFALVALIILSPFFILVAIVIKFSSKGAVIFKQQRVGKNNVDFTLYKFRTMKVDAQSQGFLTVGGKDKRITKIGYYLRKFKFDELPQLFNVIKGEMSIVGPRPEVRYYVNFYSDEQQKVLAVLPGITDYASVKFKNENDLIAKASNPEAFYIQHILPEKINLNLQFIGNPSLKNYFTIIWLTAKGIFKK